MSSLKRSKPFAVMVGTGVIATAGYMYIAGNQSKRATQSASIYKSEKEGAGLTTGTTDALVGSQAIRAAVHGDKAVLEKARH